MTRKKHPGRYHGSGHRDLALLTAMEQMTQDYSFTFGVANHAHR